VARTIAPFAQDSVVLIDPPTSAVNARFVSSSGHGPMVLMPVMVF
jgi:hypothetical protein